MNDKNPISKRTVFAFWSDIDLLFGFLFRFFINLRFRKPLEVALIDKDQKVDFSTILRVIPPILLTISGGLLAIALARPQSPEEHVELIGDGIDIILALDISQSLDGMDL